MGTLRIGLVAHPLLGVFNGSGGEDRLSPRRIKALQNIQRWRGIEQFQHLNYEFVRIRLEHLYRLARIALHHFCKQLP